MRKAKLQKKSDIRKLNCDKNGEIFVIDDNKQERKIIYVEVGTNKVRVSKLKKKTHQL